MTEFACSTLVPSNTGNDSPEPNLSQFVQDVAFAVVDGFMANPMTKALYCHLLIGTVNHQIAEINPKSWEISLEDVCEALNQVLGWGRNNWLEYHDQWLDDKHGDLHFIVQINDSDWMQAPFVRGTIR